MKIKLNSTTSIDLPKLIETRLLVQANSGGGKSYAIRRIIEQAFGKVQIIVLDPEGEFTNLREKFDFTLCGKGMDAPVESRSAALLAHRLLELKASAIIDLYELPSQERKHFVHLFCEAMVNAPKELWHEVLVIIDEAHIFAPEKGESEAMGPVIDLATRGRKRGYCVVLATQRLSKLNKDAAAECNNKLIGRASQDIDRKRAAEELGFTTKEQIRSLRDLEPGEFYVFGPAISREVVRTSVGDVQVKPPSRGSARSLKTPPPSAKVRAILAELKDLPQEAEQEARTVKELKAALTSSKQEMARMAREANRPVIDLEALEKARGDGRRAAMNECKREIDQLTKALQQVYKISSIVGIEIVGIQMKPPKLELPPQRYVPRPASDFGAVTIGNHDEDDSPPIGKGELKVLAALAQYEGGMTREHITVATGYKRSTRDAYVARLSARGYVQVLNNSICATVAGMEALPYHELLPTGEELIAHYIRTLPGGESKVFQYLVGAGNQEREEVSNATGFKRSTRDAYLQRLMSRQLVVSHGGSVVGVNMKLYE